MHDLVITEWSILLRTAASRRSMSYESIIHSVWVDLQCNLSVEDTLD